ncbi:MAG TPA: hypothetical protein VI564_07895 [Candidatus Nanoarchaeia archaeon]|nr:hypothetical protein [Candidatus Nanoarchaeia archaeon]
MTFKKWWGKLKHWQKCAIFGVLTGFILPIVFMIVIELYFISDLILKMYYLPRLISLFLLEDANCGWCLQELAVGMVILGIFQFALIGAVIGFIIEKIKKKG